MKRAEARLANNESPKRLRELTADRPSSADLNRTSIVAIERIRELATLRLVDRVIAETLNAEGHPIYPGAAGENITVEGIDWSALRPGTVM